MDVRNRLTQRALHAAAQEKPVVETSEPRSWLILDHHAVKEPAVGRYEVSLVMGIGHPALGALVLDELVLLEAAQRHSKLDFPPEKPDHDPGLVARGAPLRTRLDPDKARPVPRPVGDVRYKREADFDGHRKIVLVLDPNHPSASPTSNLNVLQRIASARECAGTLEPRILMKRP